MVTSEAYSKIIVHVKPQSKYRKKGKKFHWYHGERNFLKRVNILLKTRNLKTTIIDVPENP